MSELLLPIGSVVQLREAEKPVMIFGVYQQQVSSTFTSLGSYA